ncbi:MAG: hypothetical protein ABIS17_07760 [Casimicrobiaceae bacterium]
MAASVPVTPRRALAAVAGALSTSIAAHLLFGVGYAHWVVLIEAVLVALACAGWALRLHSRAPLALLWIIAGVALVALAATARLPFYVPSVAINLLLAWLFGHTLDSRHEPLITRIARLEHDGSMDDPTARYTRTLTAIWCAFFLASASVSLALASFASQQAWSWFANVANFPLAMILFAGEYAYRLRRFRDRSHTSPLTAIARFASASAALFGSNGGGSR